MAKNSPLVVDVTLQCFYSVISFFLNVSPIWLLQEKTTGKDRTCDIYRGYREELALGEVWRDIARRKV